MNVSGSYDAVVGAAIYAPANHVPYDAIVDMIRITKQGKIFPTLLTAHYCLHVLTSLVR